MKPTFIGLGAQKCASTWIYRVLESHPDAGLPAIKEIDFFSSHFDRGFQWYERHFDGCSGARCAGEVSPSYFHDASAPERVRDYCPSMKLLVTLRDPVERAVSNHRHEVRLGHITGPDLSFERGLRNNPMYVEQGLYGKHLGHWLSFFPRQQFFVALVEDIRSNPVAVARDLFRFLEIDDSFESPVLTERFNASFANRSQGLVRLKDRLYHLSESPGLGWLWSAAAGIGGREIYRRLNMVDSDEVIPPVPPETLQALRRRLAPDVRRLETLLNRNLDHWLEEQGAEQESTERISERVSGGSGR